jgi:hypothetical protein
LGQEHTDRIDPYHLLQIHFPAPIFLPAPALLRFSYRTIGVANGLPVLRLPVKRPANSIKKYALEVRNLDV